MKCRTDSGRRGFTLIELLVVMTIIAILMALLLPAVQAIREAANMTYCSNNMKQLALGCSDYAFAHKKLPPGLQFDQGEDPTRSDKFRPNWVILILPYLELGGVHDEFQFDKLISHLDNSDPRGTSLQVMICPTDSGHETNYAGDSSEGEEWARGNYGANVGHGNLRDFGQTPDRNPWYTDKRKRGVMGLNVSETIDRVSRSDGTTNTILLAELRVGVDKFDRRGTWAMGTAGASVVVWAGFDGDADGPNPCNNGADDIEGANRSDQSIITRECMGIHANCPSYQASSRSRHTAKGVNVAMVDGSVHFISNSIHLGSRGCCSVWDRLFGSREGESVSAELLNF